RFPLFFLLLSLLAMRASRHARLLLRLMSSDTDAVSAFIGLGSNLGDRPANMLAAYRGLQELGHVEDTSFLYETKPWGLKDQPCFLNCVCKLRTSLPPDALLGRLKDLEARLGRAPTGRRWGPRVVDLDLLFYDEVVVSLSAHPPGTAFDGSTLTGGGEGSSGGIATEPSGEVGGDIGSVAGGNCGGDGSSGDGNGSIVTASISAGGSSSSGGGGGGGGSAAQLALEVPHPRAHLREFVLRPLCDLAPDLVHPVSHRTLAELLEDLMAGQEHRRATAVRVMPVGRRRRQLRPLGNDSGSSGGRGGGQGGGSAGIDAVADSSGTREAPAAAAEGASSGEPAPEPGPPAAAAAKEEGEETREDEQEEARLWAMDARSYVMGILNVTPDSFSDGGAYGGSVEAAVERALEMEREGADIVDVGGESTRPGATPISPEEEAARVVPVIAAIRRRAATLPVSVDTRSAAVAAAAAAAGADMINDVSGGLHDPEMLPTAAALALPFVMMHMRGTPETMAHLTRYDDVVTEVGAALAARGAAAAAAGLPRWLHLMDPG
ncbi:unnamed protein product, partial [Phaeothamnion confervicola]